MKTTISHDFHIFFRIATGVACEKRFLITLAFVCFTSSSARTIKVALPTKIREFAYELAQRLYIFTRYILSFICVPISVMFYLAKQILRCPTRVPNVMDTRVEDIP